MKVKTLMSNRMKLFPDTISVKGENMRAITELKRNTRVYSLNPTIASNLIESEEVFFVNV